MGLFGGGSSSYSNPSDAAMPYLNQIPSTVTPAYTPAINLGKGATRATLPTYQQRLNDPGAAQNDLMSGYQTSDAYNYNQQKLTAQQAGTAAAGGFTGTPYDQEQQAATTAGLLSQDEQQYYNNNLQLQNSSLNAGMHYTDMGYQASDTLANLLANNLAAQSGVAYQGAAYQNNLQAQQRNNLIGAGGTVVGASINNLHYL